MDVPVSQSLQHHHSPKSSSSSAVDLTRTPGLASSGPSSPALDPSDTAAAIARRRTSWGRVVDAGQDPLRLHIPPATDTDGRFNLDPRLGNNNSGRVYNPNEDPFYSPMKNPSTAPYLRDMSFGNTNNTRYGGGGPGAGDEFSPYSTVQPGPSSTSLISPPLDGRRTGGTESSDDDEIRLTTHMSRHASADSQTWNEGFSSDPERIGANATTPKSRRKTLRYSASPSPLKKTGTAIKVVSKNLRRVSLRVVNFAGAGLENQIRLPDGDGNELSEDEEGKEDGEDLKQNLPVRGRTLGFLGPKNWLRLSLFHFLVYP